MQLFSGEVADLAVKLPGWQYSCRRTAPSITCWWLLALPTIGSAGSRFVDNAERGGHCRQQNRNVLEFFVACCRARLDGSHYARACIRGLVVDGAGKSLCRNHPLRENTKRDQKKAVWQRGADSVASPKAAGVVSPLFVTGGRKSVALV